MMSSLQHRRVLLVYGARRIGRNGTRRPIAAHHAATYPISRARGLHAPRDRARPISTSGRVTWLRARHTCTNLPPTRKPAGHVSGNLEYAELVTWCKYAPLLSWELAGSIMIQRDPLDLYCSTQHMELIIQDHLWEKTRHIIKTRTHHTHTHTYVLLTNHINPRYSHYLFWASLPFSHLNLRVV